VAIEAVLPSFADGSQDAYLGGCELSLSLFFLSAGPDPVVCGVVVCGGVV
jgi:hypothetical protein